MVYLFWQTKHWVSSTALGQYITNQVLLSIVSCEDSYLVWRVAL